MSTFYGGTEPLRERQDHVERHIYGDLEYVGGSSVIKVQGTGTEDQEVMNITTGFGFRLPKDTDAEVVVFSSSSDSGLKMGIITLPIDKQRQWQEGRGGIQNPMDPDHALEFRNGQLHLTKGTFSVGDGGTIEVKDGQVYIRANVTITGTLTVNDKVVTPTVIPGTDPDVPPFSA